MMPRKKKEPDYVDIVVDLGRSLHRDVALRAAFDGLTLEDWITRAILYGLVSREMPPAATGTTWMQITV